MVAILTWEAKLLLSRTQPTIIAITGNVGKTSTKDAIYAVVKEHLPARKSQKSLNSEIGVPLTILGLENAWSNPILWLKNLVDGLLIAIHPGQYPKILVLEIGVDTPGDMAALTTWLKPDIVVLTRLPEVPVHVEYFVSPEAVIVEKMQLVEALKADGTLVYNHDDEKINQLIESVRQKAIGYSRYSPSQFFVQGDRIVYDGSRPVGMEFDLTYLDTEAVMRVQGSLGVQHAYNYAAAVAVGSLFNISIIDATAALTKHTPPPGRMRILPGLKDTMLIDDSYNSSPVASERALQTLQELDGFSRKIVVLGDMLELGKYSSREHEKVGEQVPKVADILITVGIRARKIAEAALENGMSEKNIYQYDDVKRAGRELQQLMKSGDVILIKASQSIRAELIVEEVMAEPERAEELLVRQDPGWKSVPVRVP